MDRAGAGGSFLVIAPGGRQDGSPIRAGAIPAVPGARFSPGKAGRFRSGGLRKFPPNVTQNLTKAGKQGSFHRCIVAAMGRLPQKGRM